MNAEKARCERSRTIVDMLLKTVALVNNKGGVEKTTSAVNLAADLSHGGAEALGNLIHRR